MDPWKMWRDSVCYSSKREPTQHQFIFFCRFPHHAVLCMSTDPKSAAPRTRQWSWSTARIPASRGLPCGCPSIHSKSMLMTTAFRRSKVRYILQAIPMNLITGCVEGALSILWSGHHGCKDVGVYHLDINVISLTILQKLEKRFIWEWTSHIEVLPRVLPRDF